MAQKGPWVEIVCGFCKKIFLVPLRRKNLAQFCSRHCHDDSRRGVPLTEEHKAKLRGFIPHNKGVPMSEEQKKKVSESKKGNSPSLTGNNNGMWKGTKTPVLCKACGKTFWEWPPRNKKRKYCSVECSQKTERGSLCHLWKGGHSKGYKTGYWTKEYKDWRTVVFERDNYTCQECNASGIYLEAHHIKGFTKYPEYRFDVSNGRTLCRPCHMDFHWPNRRKAA